MACSADLDPAFIPTHEHYTRLQRNRGAMGPDQKALLAELDKRFAAQEKRFDGLEQKLDSTAASFSTRLDTLESAAKVFDEWCPGVDGVGSVQSTDHEATGMVACWTTVAQRRRWPLPPTLLPAQTLHSGVHSLPFSPLPFPYLPHCQDVGPLPPSSLQRAGLSSVHLL